MKAEIIELVAHIKNRMSYGSEIIYPFLTLFTAVGVAKVAFGIPAAVAAVLIIFIVFGLGAVLFHTGIFSNDRDIQWRKTPIAYELCKRVERIEKMLQEKEKDD